LFYVLGKGRLPIVDGLGFARAVFGLQFFKVALNKSGMVLGADDDLA